MAETNPTTGEFESAADAQKAGVGAPALWLKQIQRAKKDEEKWRDTAKNSVSVYEAQKDSESVDAPAFNIVHSNIEVTVPALYNSTPIPDVRRRYGDLDPVAKQAVDTLERSLSYFTDEYDFDGTISEAVRDSELVGRGFVRVRFEAEPTKAQASDGTEYSTATGQKVSCEHVVWDRWGHGPARTWSRVSWIYFEHDLTKDDLEKLGVPPARIKQLAWESSDDDKDGKASSGVWKTVRAYEIWDKASRKVLFLVDSKQEREFLATKDDPYGLRDFFPGCPLQPLRQRKDLTPICPYEVYEPLIRELDKVTRRINSLIGQLKVRGIYDKRLAAELEQLRLCEDGQYVPADDATQFATGGKGLEGAVHHWPMVETITALKELYVQREQIKQTIYEVTGLSDVLRGATDPRETLGAQQLKAQTGSQRLSQRQGKVARFCRDLFRIKAELICTKFTPESLAMMTGVQITPEVYQVLQNDMLRSYRIDIESDSTVRADVQRSQEQMNLFLQGTAQYASAMAPVLELAPGSKQAIVQIYAAFARSFKLGKSAEDALDALVEQAAQPEEPKPDPEAQKAQLEQQRAEHQMALDERKAQMEMQLKTFELQMKQQMAQIDMQVKQMDLQIKQQLAELDMRKAQMQAAYEAEGMQMRREGMAMEAEHKRVGMEMDLQAKQADVGAKRELAQIDRQAKLRENNMVDMEDGEEPADPALTMLRKVSDMMQQLAVSNQQVIAAVSAPKRLMIERDKTGRVAGAVATSQSLDNRGLN